MKTIKTIEMPVATYGDIPANDKLSSNRYRGRRETDLNNAVNDGFTIINTLSAVLNGNLMIVYTLLKDDESEQDGNHE